MTAGTEWCWKNWEESCFTILFTKMGVLQDTWFKPFLLFIRTFVRVFILAGIRSCLRWTKWEDYRIKPCPPGNMASVLWRVISNCLHFNFFNIQNNFQDCRVFWLSVKLLLHFTNFNILWSAWKLSVWIELSFVLLLSNWNSLQFAIHGTQYQICFTLEFLRENYQIDFIVSALLIFTLWLPLNLLQMFCLYKV